MGYCTEAEVYEAVKLNTTAIPSMLNFITAAEKDVDRWCQTTFWSVTEDGTASSSTSSILTDSTKAYVVNSLVGQILWIYSGTGSGQARTILSNTATAITVESAYSTTPDNTSKYRIIHTATEANISDAIDGNDKSSLFVDKYPIRILQSLSIDGTSITPANCFIYNKTGRILLGENAEEPLFVSYPPQAISINYWFGVYPIPEDVRRFCILSASLKALGAQMGGTYDTPSMYQLPEASVTVGQAYINIEGTYRTLKQEYDELKARLPRYPSFFS